MSTKPLPQDNLLLGALSPEVQDRLYPDMKLVELNFGEVVYETNLPMRYVYFPTDAIISLQYSMESGTSTGVMEVGNQGLLGLNLCLAGERTPTRSLVQCGGFAYRLPRRLVRQEFKRHEELLLLMLRYTQLVITQLSQTVVCNRRHSSEQQLCRWLLLSLDRLSHTNLTLTQDFIGDLLGVRRETVTQAARKLRDLGAISYTRGDLKVLDRTQLEALSCECYEVVREQTELLLGHLQERQTIKNTETIPMASSSSAS